MPEGIEFTCVSEKQPTPQQLADLKFAWLCVKHVKSNAITIAKVWYTRSARISALGNNLLYLPGRSDAWNGQWTAKPRQERGDCA